MNQLICGFFVVGGIAMLAGGGLVRNAGSLEGGLIMAFIGLVWMLVGGLVLVRLRSDR